MYDVFISYRRDGGYAMARLVYEHLQQLGLKPFWDYKELRSGPFNLELYQRIEECNNFLLVLPANALDRCRDEADWLRLEITHAIEKKKNIIPLLMNGFHWPAELPEAIAKLPVYNAVHMSNDYFDASVDKIVGMLKNSDIASSQTAPHKEGQRYGNAYFHSEDKKEIRRLRIQQNLMKQFDQPIYNRVLTRYPQARVLDIGCNNGDFIMDRIVRSGDVAKLLGLEYEQTAVDTANQKYGKPGQIAFYCCDVESDDLDDRLEELIDAEGIEEFDIINISMVILHLKNPYKLLKILRRYLRKGGSMVIKDIDDGLNLAYPDENGHFRRVIDICNRNEESGFRQSGRQIFTLLQSAGYTDIKLERSGLTTIGMDYEERAALFDVYFSFILEDLKLMAERYPADRHIQKDLEWYKDFYDDLERMFLDPIFFFSLGFMLFTATK